jgi:23S rRNA pseudouridine2605 synthase
LHPAATNRKHCGLARALSKLGYCSRTQAFNLIRAGRVQLNDATCREPEQPVQLHRDKIRVDNHPLQPAKKLYLMLNKPRGLVTTASDEKGRATVFDCFANAELPFLAPVGRLDKASEGLLLFTNDTSWANALTDPNSQVDKIYHVQVSASPPDHLLRQIQSGTTCDGERLAAKQITRLRAGEKNSWLELVLDEGKNRHIRRLLTAFNIEVVRLIRVAIGSLQLGTLPKGKFRLLTDDERRQLLHASTRRLIENPRE